MFGCISYLTSGGFIWKCPHRSQRIPRISSVCNGNTTLYTCLYDTLKKKYAEFCSSKDDYVRPGLYITMHICTSDIFFAEICNISDYISHLDILILSLAQAISKQRIMLTKYIAYSNSTFCIQILSEKKNAFIWNARKITLKKTLLS